VLRIVWILPPRTRRTAITTMAMRDKIRAYSARPYPSSRRKREEKYAI
jgi:hypothetical protein